MQHGNVETLYDRVQMEGLGTRWALPLWAIGVLGLAGALGLGFVGGEQERFYRSYLFAWIFFLTVGLGGLFFVLAGHLTRAGWNVAVRRVPEALGAALLPMAVLSIPVLLGLHQLYPWTDAAHVAASHHLQAKTPYLNVPFFLVRCAIYFVSWAGLAWWFLARSTEQDRTGDPGLTLRMERTATWAIYVFALTVTFASFDFLMSLSPEWYSTIFGVYVFAGAAVAAFALTPLVVSALQATGRIEHAVTTEHMHDLGKLVFAFVVFWAYIGFSQYMLIWYGNIPEETVWYARRQEAGWAGISILLLVGHFLVPFLLLMSRYPKRRRGTLLLGCLWVLLMHAVDVYWIVMPAGGPFAPHLLDLLCFVGVGGTFLAGVVEVLRRRPLLPLKDPRLGESLRFENV